MLILFFSLILACSEVPSYLSNNNAKCFLVLALEHQYDEKSNATRLEILNGLIPKIQSRSLVYNTVSIRDLLVFSNTARKFLQDRLNGFNNNKGQEVAVLKPNLESGESFFVSDYSNVRIDSIEIISTKVMLNNLREILISNREVLPTFSNLKRLLESSSNLCSRFNFELAMVSDAKGFFYVDGALEMNDRLCIFWYEKNPVIKRVNLSNSVSETNALLKNLSHVFRKSVPAQISLLRFVERVQETMNDGYYYIKNCKVTFHKFVDFDCNWELGDLNIKMINFSSYQDNDYDGTKTLADFNLNKEPALIHDILRKFGYGEPSLASVMLKEKNKNAAIFVSRLMHVFNITVCSGNCIWDLEKHLGTKLYMAGGKYCWEQNFSVQCGSKLLYEKVITQR